MAVSKCEHMSSWNSSVLRCSLKVDSAEIRRRFCERLLHTAGMKLLATGGYVGTVSDNLPHSTRDVSVHRIIS